MKAEKKVGRREILRALGVGAGAAAAASGAPIHEAAASESSNEARKARYQANSPDVQAYYCANRYPAKSN